MNDFMKGRNGADELTIVMGFAGIVIAMIGSIARIQWLSNSNKIRIVGSART